MTEKSRSIAQKVANRGRELKLSRQDAFVTYAMGRLLFRLGSSKHAESFYLKGGVLIASMLDTPHRFSRDIDLLRVKGACDPEKLRKIFRDVAEVHADDCVEFVSTEIKATLATRDIDGYDGIKLLIPAKIGQTSTEVSLDIGFGDAVVPPATRLALRPFLQDEPPARVFAYSPETVIAEKIETLVFKFPLIEHRLKDILDVLVLADLAHDRELLLASLGATLQRRGRTKTDIDGAGKILNDMKKEMKGQRWLSAWARMCKDKAVVSPPGLADALGRFTSFVGPLLRALCTGS